MRFADRRGRTGSDPNQTILTGVLETDDPTQLVTFTYTHADQLLKIMLLEDRYAGFGCGSDNHMSLNSSVNGLPIFINRNCNNVSDFALTRIVSPSVAHSYSLSGLTPSANYDSAVPQEFTVEFAASMIKNGADQIAIGGFASYNDLSDSTDNTALGAQRIWLQVLDADNSSDPSALTLKTHLHFQITDFVTVDNTYIDNLQRQNIRAVFAHYYENECNVDPSFCLIFGNSGSRSYDLIFVFKIEPFYHIFIQIYLVGRVQQQVNYSAFAIREANSDSAEPTEIELLDFAYSIQSQAQSASYDQILLFKVVSTQKRYIMGIHKPKERYDKNWVQLIGTSNNRLIDNIVDSYYSYGEDNNNEVKRRQLYIGGNTLDQPGYLLRLYEDESQSKACVENVAFRDGGVFLHVVSNLNDNYEDGDYTEFTDNQVALTQTHQVATLSLTETQYAADLTGQNPERNPCLMTIEKEFTANVWTMVHPSKGVPINLVTNGDKFTSTCPNDPAPPSVDANISPFEFKIKSVVKAGSDVTSSQNVVTKFGANFQLQSQLTSDIGTYTVSYYSGFEGVSQTLLALQPSQSLTFEVVGKPTVCQNLVVPAPNALSIILDVTSEDDVTIDLIGISNNDCEFSVNSSLTVQSLLATHSEPADDTLFKVDSQPSFVDKNPPVPANKATPAQKDLSQSAKIKVVPQDNLPLGKTQMQKFRVTFTAESADNAFDPLSATLSASSSFEVTFACDVTFASQQDIDETIRIGEPLSQDIVYESRKNEQCASTTIQIYDDSTGQVSNDSRFAFVLDTSTGNYKFDILANSLDQIGDQTFTIWETSDVDPNNKVSTNVALSFTDPCSGLQLQAPSQQNNAFTYQTRDKEGNIDPTETEAAFLDLQWSQFVANQALPALCTPTTLSIEISSGPFLARASLEPQQSKSLTTVDLASRKVELDLQEFGVTNGQFSLKIKEGFFRDSYANTIANQPTSETDYPFEIAQMIQQNNTSNITVTKQFDDLTQQEELLQDSPTNQNQINKKSSQAETLNFFTPNFSNKSINLEAERPIVTRANISKTGIVHLEFSKPLLIPNAFQFYQEKEASLNLTLSLFEIEVLSDFYQSGAPEIDIESFQIQEFNETNIKLRVNFNEPSQISLSQDSQDLIRVTFVAPQFFRDSIDFRLIQNQTEVFINLPQQMSEQEQLDIESFARKVSSPFAVFSFWTLLINLLLAAGLKHLWNFANIIQFILYFAMWQVNLPQQTRVILNELKKIGLFEFVETKELIKQTRNWFFSTDHNSIDKIDLDQSTQKFEIKEISYQSWLDLVDDGGILMLVGVCLVLSLILVVLFGLLTRADSCGHRIYKRIKKNLLYNSVIRYVLQSCLKWQVSLTAALLLLSNNSRENYGSLLAISALLLLLCLVPLMFIAILGRQRDQLDSEGVRDKIGSLYEGLVASKEKGKASVYHAAIFLGRRTFFVALTFGLLPLPGLQTQIFIVSGVAYLGYLHLAVRFEERFSKSIETLNEVITILVAYHLVLLTNLVWALPLRAQIGTSLICCIALLIFFNSAMIARINVRFLVRKIRLYRVRKMITAVQTERKIALEAISAAIKLNETNADTKLAQIRDKASSHSLTASTTKFDLEMSKVREEVTTTKRILQGEYEAVDKATKAKLNQIVRKWKIQHGSLAKNKHSSRLRTLKSDFQFDDDFMEKVKQFQADKRKNFQESKNVANASLSQQSEFDQTKTLLNRSSQKLISSSYNDTPISNDLNMSSQSVKSYPLVHSPKDQKSSTFKSKRVPLKTSQVKAQSDVERPQVEEGHQVLDFDEIRSLDSFEDLNQSSTNKNQDSQLSESQSARGSELKKQNSLEKPLQNESVLSRNIQTPRSEKPSEARSSLRVIEYQSSRGSFTQNEAQQEGRGSLSRNSRISRDSQSSQQSLQQKESRQKDMQRNKFVGGKASKKSSTFKQQKDSKLAMQDRGETQKQVDLKADISSTPGVQVSERSSQESLTSVPPASTMKQKIEDRLKALLLVQEIVHVQKGQHADEKEGVIEMMNNYVHSPSPQQH